MGSERKNPNKFLYEPGMFHGVSVIGTGANLDHTLIPEGFFCYDIRNPGNMEGETEFFIVQEPIPEAAEGCIITAGPIDFRGKGELSLEHLKIDEDAYMMSLEEFVHQHMNQETNETPVNDMIQI